MVKNIILLVFTSVVFSGCFWNKPAPKPKLRSIDSCNTNQCVDDSDFRYYYNDFDRY